MNLGTTELKWNPFKGGLFTPWHWEYPDERWIYSCASKELAINTIHKMEIYRQDRLVAKLKTL